MATNVQVMCRSGIRGDIQSCNGYMNAFSLDHSSLCPLSLLSSTHSLSFLFLVCMCCLVSLSPVFRFRPPSKNERADGSSIVVSVDHACTSVSLSEAGMAAANGGSSSGGGSGAASKYTFDRVFDLAAAQEEVFKYTAEPLVKEVFQGYNTTIFA